MPPTRRQRRRTRPRATTLSIARIRGNDRARAYAGLFEIDSREPTPDVQRPRTRGDCLPGGCNEERPCPFVGCADHLYLDVNPITGSLKINFPDLEPWELAETCARDVGARGGLSLEETGALMNLTRERIRQYELTAFHKLKATDELRELAGDYATDQVAEGHPDARS